MKAPCTIRPILFSALLALAGCTLHPVRPVPTPNPPSPPPGTAVAQGIPYEVDPSASLLTILVFRGGTLARAGHNHVIASHDLNGVLHVPQDLTQASFELNFPVGRLSVDEPELRAAAGADFPAGVPDSAREGTRRNMLSPALLDAEHYPEIRLRSREIAVLSPGELQAQVELAVRGQDHIVTVPIHFEQGKDTLTATGELALKQSELGLTPFSAMLGALQVLDDFKIRFTLRANQRPESSESRPAAP